MGVLDWTLELFLIGALGVTAFHAIRLERALRVLRHDRAAVGELVAGFDNSARNAGQGLDQLRHAAESAGRQIARHVEAAAALKDDLAYLTERGNRLADRMDALVQAGRPAEMAHEPTAPVRTDPPASGPGRPLRSQAERDLLKALGVVR